MTGSSVALVVAAAAAVTLDVTAGEWAALRLTDDLHATARTAAAAFAAYTAGVTVARFGGVSAPPSLPLSWQMPPRAHLADLAPASRSSSSAIGSQPWPRRQ